MISTDVTLPSRLDTDIVCFISGRDIPDQRMKIIEQLIGWLTRGCIAYSPLLSDNDQRVSELDVHSILCYTSCVKLLQRSYSHPTREFRNMAASLEGLYVYMRCDSLFYATRFIISDVFVYKRSRIWFPYFSQRDIIVMICPTQIGLLLHYLYFGAIPFT